MKKLLRLPGLLDGVVVVQVIVADGVCGIPVRGTPGRELFPPLDCPRKKFLLWDVAFYWLHIDNYELVLGRSLISGMERRK